MSLRISVAGRVSISNGGVLIEEERLAGRQGRLVFAYLVSEHARPVTRDELAEALWGETPPARWDKALGVIASKLRAVLGECGLDGAKALTGAFGCYRLELPERTWIDILAAARGVDEAEAALAAGDVETARAEAATAASLARLPLLPGEDGSWVEGKRRELADVLVRAVECLADACLRSGDASQASKWAQEAMTLEPFRESGYRLLMQAHAAAGNTAEALRIYERCRRLLSEELGAYPSPETESVYRALLELPSSRTDGVDAAEDVAKPPSRPGRRVMVAAALVAGALAAALAAMLLIRGSGSTERTSVAANAVGVIDAEGGEVLAGIQVAGAPGEVAAGRDAIWVTSSDVNSVSRIDPSTNDVRQTIQVGGGPAGIAVSPSAVWVANGLDGTVSRVDPATSQVVQTITVGNGPSGVAYGGGAVWVTNSADGTVSEIDPETGHVRRTLPAVSGASAVAVGFGRVWVVSPSSGAVVALDPSTGRVLRRIGVGVDPDAVAAGAGALWVANRADGTVSRIDPQAGAVTRTIEIGRGPQGVAAGHEGIWVANGADGTISRIDPADGTTTTIRVDNQPRGVALSPQGVYVAVRPTGSEHLGGTLRVALTSRVNSIDPALARPFVWSVLILTNDGLVGFRRVGGVQGAQLVPDLAVALPTPTDGGRTYTFQVRSGIRYSNGESLEPADFKRAIEHVFEAGGLEYAYYYTGIVGTERCAKGKSCDLTRGIVVDRGARTVTFRLRRPDADFLAKLALPAAFALPVGIPAPELGMHNLPATGPYRIANYRNAAKTIRLVRNPRFHQWSADAQPDGYPDSISWSWRFGIDPAAEVRAVERGAVDVALGGSGPPLSRRQLDALAVRYPSQLHMNTQLGTTSFFLNTRVPPFDDVRARRAVNYALDRDALAGLLGPAFASTCQVLPPNFPGYRRTCPYGHGGAHGLDTARRLVRASGNVGTTVTVWVPRPLANQGRYVVSVLNMVGYRARLREVDPDAYFAAVSDSRVGAQIGYYTWFAAYPSAADFIPPQLSCAAFVPDSRRNGNLSAFCDPAIDERMARAAAAQVQDPAAATGLWEQVERQLLARAPVVPAYNRRNVDFVSKRVGNYQYNPQWGLLLDQVWVE